MGSAAALLTRRIHACRLVNDPTGCRATGLRGVGGRVGGGVAGLLSGRTMGGPAFDTTLPPVGFTPLLEAQSLVRLGALYDQPARGPGASLRLFAVPAKSDRGPSPACRAPVERG